MWKCLQRFFSKQNLFQIRSQMAKMSTKDPKPRSPNKRTTSTSEDNFRRKPEFPPNQQQPQQQQVISQPGIPQLEVREGAKFVKKRKLEMASQMAPQNNSDFEIKKEVIESSDDPNSRSMSGRKKVFRRYLLFEVGWFWKVFFISSWTFCCFQNSYTKLLFEK